jgi:uncharacterized glyoxalase superfamily metalloenzyme YdcJ
MTAGVLVTILAVTLVAHFGIMGMLPMSSCDMGDTPTVCVMTDAIDALIATTPFALAIAVIAVMAIWSDRTLRNAVVETLRRTTVIPISSRAPSARALAERTMQRQEALRSMWCSHGG